MILFAIFCILIISLFVISKFSFARLREEHLEDMDSLSDGKKEELREIITAIFQEKMNKHQIK